MTPRRIDTDASHARARTGERGFTLTELLVVMLILSILLTAAWMGIQGARTASRAHAMTGTASTVAQAASAFNRMRPPIQGNTPPDPLMSGTTFTPTQSEAAGGLYSITGERLLDPWPVDPYTGNPVTIRRQAACPASVAVGQVVICRVGGTSRSTFRVLGGAKDKDGNAYVVFNKTFG